MAAQASRSVINMIFILLLTAAFLVAAGLTWDMLQDALTGPGPIPGA
jgi:hypothetical protein